MWTSRSKVHPYWIIVCRAGTEYIQGMLIVVFFLLLSLGRSIIVLIIAKLALYIYIYIYDFSLSITLAYVLFFLKYSSWYFAIHSSGQSPFFSNDCWWLGESRHQNDTFAVETLHKSSIIWHVSLSQKLCILFYFDDSKFFKVWVSLRSFHRMVQSVLYTNLFVIFNSLIVTPLSYFIDTLEISSFVFWV